MIVRTSAELARLIDHTTLRSDVTAAEVEQYCQEAIEWNFASVCVNPIHVPRVAACLAGSAVRTCSVIGFPLGASPTALKRAELDWVIEQGASEIDAVICSIDEVVSSTDAACSEDDCDKDCAVAETWLAALVSASAAVLI